jgi:carbon monoxide dehydrogenase subunit G
MNLNGERSLPAARQAVWDALNDPAVLRDCLPGCERMERVSDTAYTLTLLAVVGPVKAKFAGKLVLADIDAPRSYALDFEGAGGATGFGKGRARVALDAPGGDRTQLSYHVDVQVGGKIAQVGARLIDGVARKIIEAFFSKFEAQLAARGEADTQPSGAARPE